MSGNRWKFLKRLCRKKRTVRFITDSPLIKVALMTNIEKEIADSIAQSNGLSIAQLGLRFDKVVVRLLGKLRTTAGQAMPEGQTVIVTITAPIKLPAKTTYELEMLIRDYGTPGSPPRDHIATIFRNEVCIRIITTSSAQTAGLIGLVHNPGIDAKLLLNLATRWLRENQ